jgi:hypothetical protein
MGGWLSSGLEGGHCHIRPHSAKTKNNLVLKICYMFRNAPNFAAPRRTSPRRGQLRCAAANLAEIENLGIRDMYFPVCAKIFRCVPALVSSIILDILTTTESKML